MNKKHTATPVAKHPNGYTENELDFYYPLIGKATEILCDEIKSRNVNHTTAHIIGHVALRCWEASIPPEIVISYLADLYPTEPACNTISIVRRTYNTMQHVSVSA